MLGPLSLHPSPDIALSTDASSIFLGSLRRLVGCSGAGLFNADGQALEIEGTPPPVELGSHLADAAGRAQDLSHLGMGLFLVVPMFAVDVTRPFYLVLWDRLPRPPLQALALLARLTELVYAATVEHRRTAESHRRLLVERASATARIGIWSCSLPDETLIWTDGVYDMFDVPRGSRIDRQTTLNMYEPQSAKRMSELRSQAIATLGDFSFDAEITTAAGRQRWIRITATVDGIDGRARRIFGMKQDITEEKRLAERTRVLAETDSLTGLANRAVFNARLEDMHGVKTGRPVAALILVDLDRFKAINDTLGHRHGDQCLVETARRLRQCCPPDTLVARLGGDEFAVLLDETSGADAEAISAAIVDALSQPFVLAGAQHRVGASAGIARRGDHDADTFYHNADMALYAAKHAGRNTWRAFAA